MRNNVEKVMSLQSESKYILIREAKKDAVNT